jgi:NAD(P)-dependent dehydrogenase (short-subunit alcohol dehydrogenase family)
MPSRICIVTGAGSGIGRACSVALAERGWTVVLAGRRMAALEETAALAGGAERAVPVPADVGEPAEVGALFATVRERFGRLDLLFNNVAGTMPYTPFEDVSYEDWTRVIHTTVTGSFLCAQQAFRIMKEQSPKGGRIINNGAPSAHVPRPESAAFTAAKHAVAGLTRALSLDGRPHDIACGQIDIGNVAPPDGRPQPRVRQADRTYAVEPTMDVRRVTDAVVMMAGMPLDANVQYITVMPTKMPYVGRG